MPQKRAMWTPVCDTYRSTPSTSQERLALLRGGASCDTPNETIQAAYM